MTKIYQFPKKSPTIIRDLFSSREYEHYIGYLEQGEIWRQTKKGDTLYDGYPFVAPGAKPVRDDMTWYVNEQKNFGVWIINHSPHDIFEYEEILFGWSPFVRFSTAPPHEPIHVASLELRERLVWFVDQDGYGQYAVVKNAGELWVPVPRPVDWDDHNKKYGYL